MSFLVYNTILSIMLEMESYFAFYERHFSPVSWLITMHFNFIPCFLSYVFFVAFIPHLISLVFYSVGYLICFMFMFKLSVNLQAAQAVHQHLNRVWNHVSTSSYVSKSVMSNKDWDRTKLEEQGVYR